MIILRQKEFGKLAGSKEQVQKRAKQFFTKTGKQAKKVANQTEMAKLVAEGSDGYGRKGKDYLFKDIQYRMGDPTAGNRGLIEIGEKKVPRGSMMRIVRGNDISNYGRKTLTGERSEVSKFVNPKKLESLGKGMSIDEVITRRGN